MKKKSKRTKAAAGKQGGIARAKRMTAEERSESAKRAAQARWLKELERLTPAREAKLRELERKISGYATEKLKARIPLPKGEQQ